MTKTIHDDLRDHMLAVERELMQVRKERDSARQAFAAADKRRHEAEVWVERLRDELQVATTHLCSERCSRAKDIHTDGCTARKRVLAGNLEGS